MALTLTKTQSGVIGDLKYWIGVVALDSSYPTGGEALGVSDIDEGWVQVDHVQIGTGNVVTKRVSYDPSAAKIFVAVEDGTTGIEAQAASTSDQSGLTDIPLFVLGR